MVLYGGVHLCRKKLGQHVRSVTIHEIKVLMKERELETLPQFRSPKILPEQQIYDFILKFYHLQLWGVCINSTLNTTDNL